MTMTYKGNFNSDLIKGRFDKVIKELATLTEEAAGDIVKRTLKGVDMELKPFAPYSPKYKAWKSGRTATGRKRTAKRKAGKVAVGSVVNLTLSGKMLKALRTETKASEGFFEGIISILPNEAGKALGNQTGVRGNRKSVARKFFGLDREQVKKIKGKIGDFIHGRR